jgi:hypothetical protein
LTYQFKEVRSERWEPWNPTIDVVLKPVLNPIPMYARKVGEPQAIRIPEDGKPIGFD